MLPFGSGCMLDCLRNLVSVSDTISHMSWVRAKMSQVRDLLGYLASLQSESYNKGIRTGFSPASEK